VSGWPEFYNKHKGQHYTPAFNSCLEAQMADARLVLEQRICAWLMRTSWGNHSESCVTSEGIIQTQVDCARALKLTRTEKGKQVPDRQRVNHVFRRLERLGYIEVRGQEIFVKDDPAGIFASSSLEVDHKSTPEDQPTNGFRQYMETVWGAANPDDFKRLQEMEQAVKQIRTSILSEYKRHKQMSDPVLHSEEAEGRNGSDNIPERVLHSPEQGSTLAGVSINENGKQKRLASYAERIRSEVEASGLLVKGGSLDARTAQNTAKRLHALAPADRVDDVLTELGIECHQVAQRKHNRPKSWGIILTLLEDAIGRVLERDSQAPSKPPGEAQSASSIESQIATLEEALSALREMKSPQVAKVQAELDALRAQSNEHARAQEAGRG
jgi:hypothetical protein